MAKMNIEEYKARVMNHFKAFTDISNATQEDWELLGRLFLNASENGEDSMEDFDKRILSTQEFKKLYELEEFQDYTDQPPGYPFFLDGHTDNETIGE